ncbi:MAG TPA: aspartate carbamoyltransferase [Candidatus Binatia bacterium]|nr:aspartate carbamoyltransferase [Candidatus Binatia bacterium]
MTLAMKQRRLEHVVSSEQFDRECLDELFASADLMVDHRDTRLASRIMATLFYEPSTRTRLSFESAMLRLGGSVIGTEAARQFSSTIKGETLEDTIRMASTYADVIVLRHDQAGAAARAARVASVPVVNAGDGPGEHPTQALLDLYTIRSELGTAEGVHVAFCGDLRFGRTVHSLALLLSLHPGVRMTFVAPEVVQVGADLQARIAAAGVPIQLTDRLDEVIDSVDVVYQTRIQKERFESLDDFEVARRAIRIDSSVMRALPTKAIVMHPLPRVDEIATEVDDDPRAAYFRQARNGIAIRMALLDMLLG